MELSHALRVIETETNNLDMVILHWQSTFEHRKELLKQNISTEAYLAKYPVFNTQESYKLVSYLLFTCLRLLTFFFLAEMW